MLWQRIQDNLQDIAADRSRGARELAFDCARRIQADLEAASSGDGGTLELGDRKRLARAMIAAQPDMAPFYHLAVTVLAAGEDVASVANALGRLADRIESDATARTAAGLIGSEVTVASYSRSGSILAALEAGVEAGKRFRLRLGESRPGYEGREMARRAAELGIEVELATDAALLSDLGGTDLVWLGADAVCESEFRNKIGTRALCSRAAEEGTPVYVLADETKFLPRVYWMESEERSPTEVWDEAPAGVTVRNPYFEIIPLRAVEGVVSGETILDEAGVRARVESAARTLEPLEMEGWE